MSLSSIPNSFFHPLCSTTLQKFPPASKFLLLKCIFQHPASNFCPVFFLQLGDHPFDSRPNFTALGVHKLNIRAVFPLSDCAVIAGPTAYTFVPVRESRPFCDPVEEIQMIESSEIRRIGRVRERIVILR